MLVGPKPADPVDVLWAVHEACERFAGELAEALTASRPGSSLSVVRSVVSTDAWILASDIAEFIDAERNQTIPGLGDQS